MDVIDTLSNGRLSAVAYKNKITLYNIINNNSEDFILEDSAGGTTTKVYFIWLRFTLTKLLERFATIDQ